MKEVELCFERFENDLLIFSTRHLIVRSYFEYISICRNKSWAHRGFPRKKSNFRIRKVKGSKVVDVK